MNKIILFFASILFFVGIAKGQTSPIPSTNPIWAWGKDFNLSSTNPPLMTYKDGFVYIAGNYGSTLQLDSYIFPNGGGNDIYFAKINTSGTIIWAKVISQIGNQQVAGIQVNNNEVIIAGSYDAPSLQVGTTVINSVGGSDLFIAKYDTSGNNTALYNYGTVQNDNIRSLSLDYNNNIYLAGDSLYKFSNLGVKLWNIPYSANHLYYSKIDSTIVMDGYGASYSYTSGGTGLTYYYDEILVRKLTLTGNSNWLVRDTILNGPVSTNGNPYMYVSGFNETDGSHFYSYTDYGNISLSSNCYLKKVTPSGISSIVYSKTYSFDPIIIYSISSNKEYVMFSVRDDESNWSIVNDAGTHILNYNLNSFFARYNYLPEISDSYKFVDTNMIYAHGTAGSINHTFGKFGNPSLSITSNHNPNACIGSTKNINSSVTGGTPPYSYSWLPTTGLSSTNTLNTSLVANTNITYTLTVTDANGLIFSKPYDIIIDSPNVTVNITSQFPVLCDSMFLYSNPGLIGYWYKKVGNNWNYLSMAQNLKIYTSGKYKFEYYNTCGTFVDSINIIIGNSNSLINLSICSNQLPYAWNGQNLTQTGTYYDTLQNAAGCDSVATLNLTVNQTSSSTTSVSICSNQLPYSWNGQNYTSGGAHTYQTTNAVGCDSIATLNLTIKQSTSSTTNVSVCSNQLPYSWNGQNYTSGGAYTYQTTNSVGCDSTATLNLTIKQTSSSTTNVSVCSNQLPYSWNGQNYSTGGTYTFQATNAAGCDSIATMNFTIKQTSSSSTNASVCSSQLPYSWNGQNYTSSGAHTYQTTNAAGCDSIATLNLTIKQSTSSTTNASVCSNQLPYSWNGQNYTSGGAHTYQTLNAAGCDSISTLNLTINNIPLSNIIPYTDSTICIGAPIVLYADTNYSNYSWTLNGNIVSATDSVVISSSGSYLLSCTDSNNCSLTDSVSFTLNPTPQPIIIQNNYILYSANIANAYYQWSLNGTILSNNDSITITQNGSYILLVTSTSGCIGIDTFVVSALALNKFSTNHSINIYPNPTDNSFTINYDLDKTSTVDIKLLDMTGKVISNITTNENQSKGNHKKVVNLKSLSISEGMYMLQLNDGVSKYNQRIIYRN